MGLRKLLRTHLIFAIALPPRTQIIARTIKRHKDQGTHEKHAFRISDLKPFCRVFVCVFCLNYFRFVSPHVMFVEDLDSQKLLLFLCRRTPRNPPIKCFVKAFPDVIYTPPRATHPPPAKRQYSFDIKQTIKRTKYIP